MLSPPIRAIGWALLITLGQILLAIVLAGAHSPSEAYERLYCWDGGWYASIVNHGYFSPAVISSANYGNVAFFPGYPLLAWLLTKVFGLSTPIALLLIAQAACWVFWTYLLLFFERWQLPSRLRLLGVLLVLTHPAAFFLVAAYSESLFLAGLLGFLYWSGSERRGTGWLAAGHGIVMTATRLVGVPVVIFPLCIALLEKSTTRRLCRALVLGAAASLGALLFFGYCQLRFGAWDAYMQTGSAGWKIRPDYLGMFSFRVLHIHFPSPREHWIDPEFFSRLAVPVALVIFVALAVIEWRIARTRASGWRLRACLYFAAFLLLYVPVSAQCTRAMTSMVRYVLCVQVVLALAVVHLLGRIWPLEPRAQGRLRWLLLGWCHICLVLQVLFLHRFLHGRWVA